MRALICAVALAIPGTVGAAEVSIATATGEARVEQAPQPVAVLDMAAIDTLAALGVKVDGVPEFQPPAYLDEVMADGAGIGTLFEPDFEALAAMAPQLIIAGGRSQTQVEPLSAIAPTIDMTISGADLVAEAQARIAAYGAIFDRSDEAAELEARLNRRITEARDAVAGKGDAMILMTNGSKISVFGANSRFGWLHQRLDLPEAHADLAENTHGEAVSFEFVADADPDWLLVIDRGAAVGQGGEAASATLDNPLIAATTAGRSGQIVYLDSAALYLADGGFQSVMITLGLVIDAFSAAGS
ncbi:siderophore ABC transporter substrate-binding protein [Paracoccus marinaquae]|uniref:Siderophore ABC transporter substrate-binding protein n=1 Tax=Paracoccus marinaquae TaxID=2841926 RepID=A0ABS6AI40_9RHOB|nr:siderophore ABC transporter substrate-binding protein [Paracoccus marinaquae]MBU3030184.1 siderophore ABC transporter substrate-binding protein [Paracoccus marinaquae]